MKKQNYTEIEARIEERIAELEEEYELDTYDIQEIRDEEYQLGGWSYDPFPEIEEEEEEATAIEEAPTETTAPVVTGYFTLDGRLVDNPLRGNIYIQKMSNGTTRKVFFK